jgi:hypothetical protein
MPESSAQSVTIPSSQFQRYDDGMSLAFETCWHRVARAEVHRQALTQLWNGIDTQNSYISHAEINDDGTGKLFITPVKQDWLLPFSLQFGEMLYQLRGALDSCVYDAAVLKFGQSPPPDAEKWNFPFTADPSKFKEAMKRMKKIPDDIRGLIEAVQPYKAATGHHEGKDWDIGQTLEILNNWARIDRHRKLHLAGTACTSGNLQIILPSGMTLEYCNFVERTILEDKSEIAQFKIANFIPAGRAFMNPQFTFQVVVNETPRCLLSDISTAMMLSVQVIRESFERHFGLEGQSYAIYK